ncbi:MAG: sigma-70 family RNA polymerase sigma factor [Deltaproteobacteria bacterium]|nr:sigma-70 family RNA polymerase sigma factor [Deltaproteobacteria bacterium]
MSVGGDKFPRGRDGAAPAPLDAGTLARCRAQDPIAFRAFVVRHQRMVFALLSRMLGHGPETFVRAYRAFPSFDLDGPAKPSTWLLTIATRLALDAKKRKTLEAAPLDHALDAKSGSTPDLTLQRRELGAAIADAAASLPDDQRAALVLAEMHGLSIAEIAAALEVPENTAKTRLFRAREKMRAALEDEWRTP